MYNNKYEFEHPLQQKGKFVYAKSFREADELIKYEDGNSWNLIRAWDSDGNKTYDIWLGMMELPPAKISYDDDAL